VIFMIHLLMVSVKLYYMNPKKIIFLLLIFSVSLYGAAQPIKPSGVEDTALVNSLLQQSKDRLTDDPAIAISLAFQAKSLSEKIDFPKGAATASKNIGLGYRKQ